jgi:hypothetical protein
MACAIRHRFLFSDRLHLECLGSCAEAVDSRLRWMLVAVIVAHRLVALAHARSLPLLSGRRLFEPCHYSKSDKHLALFGLEDLTRGVQEAFRERIVTSTNYTNFNYDHPRLISSGT